MKTKKDKEEKVLWIDRTTGNPTKLEIKWTNKKNTVYISYNEVSLNSLK
jgi:outer membrane lipoprotein-sorting protein